MSGLGSIFGFGFGSIIVFVLVFLLLREFWCWFFKINQLRDILEKIEENTAHFDSKLQTTQNIPEPILGQKLVPTANNNQTSQTSSSLGRWWNGPKK